LWWARGRDKGNVTWARFRYRPVTIGTSLRII
jgi:hypothetical protein